MYAEYNTPFESVEKAVVVLFYVLNDFLELPENQTHEHMNSWIL